MLASVIREALAPFVLRCPPECGVVSMTEVHVVPDGGSVTVYVSAHLSTDAAVKFLRSETPALRAALSHLQLRRIPDVFVKADTRAEKAARVEQLLEE